MPPYRNKFKHIYVDHQIVASDGGVGTLRVKPSGLLWRPNGKHKFYAVPLEKFGAWIVSPETKAKLVTQ